MVQNGLNISFQFSPQLPACQRKVVMLKGTLYIMHFKREREIFFLNKN